MPVIEGYGLTETTAPLTGNLPGRIRSGTVGFPLPGSTVGISDDGEILAGGVGVFRGYRNPEQTADAFVDGLFRTGDLGHLDDDGRLVLDGRVKDVIVTSSGKTVVPATWENAVEGSPLIAHAVVVLDVTVAESIGGFGAAPCTQLATVKTTRLAIAKTMAARRRAAAVVAPR